MVNCKDCNKAYKRCHFSFERYGSRGFPYECTIAKRTTYKRPDDGCEKGEKISDGQRNITHNDR